MHTREAIKEIKAKINIKLKEEKVKERFLNIKEIQNFLEIKPRLASKSKFIKLVIKSFENKHTPF